MPMEAGPPGRAISVVVADDEPHVVEYLRTVLHLEGFDVAGTASDADGAVQMTHHLRPDVVLLDLHMPGGGISAAQLIGSLSPDTRIVIFSAEADEPDVMPLLQSGIDGYVVKGAPPDRLAEAIRAAVIGNKYLAPEVNRIALDALTTRLDAEQHETLQRQRERERITDVISHTRFVTVLQPILDLRTGRPMAVEALTRFTALPSRPPDEWLAEAERVGMRVPLELAIASVGLAELPSLPAELSLTVNISPASAVSGRLGEVLLGAPLDRIILELTEHSPVADYGALNAALAPWRAGGARLAVDDAGGGYASFAHILSMKPEFIKFDVSLTRDIHLDRPRQALARALVGFANEMDVGVIAEGVETAAQLEMIVDLGTPYAQGFHLGRPRPLGEQVELLTAPNPLVHPAVDLRDDPAGRRQS